MKTVVSDLRAFGIGICVLLAAALTSSADESKKQDAADAAQKSTDSLDMQLTKARLQLAKVELDRALAVNERMPVFTPATIQLLRRNVEVAEAKLAALKDSQQVNAHAAHVCELENGLKLAEHKWKLAIRIRERSPGLIDDARVEVLRLRVEVARLALARSKEPDLVTTPIQHIEWELDQLRDDLLDLTLRIEEQSTARYVP